MAEELVPKCIAHWSAAHGETGVAAIGLVNRIDGQHPNAVDAELVERSGRSDHGVSGLVSEVYEGASWVSRSTHPAECKTNVVASEAK